MPAWKVESASPVPAAAHLAPDDQDAMRHPTPDGPEEDIWPARGLYLGVALITAQPMGDFGEDKALVGPTAYVLIPDLDVGGGGGVYASYRWHMNELMLQYSVTTYDGEFVGSPRDHDTDIYDLDLNWRHYFLPQSPLQPYELLGFGWSRAELDNGSTLNDGNPPSFATSEDGQLKDGINVNVGAGVALYTLPWVVFYGQAMYRFVRYESSDGMDGHVDSNDVDGDSWNLSAGAAIRLLPGRK